MILYMSMTDEKFDQMEDNTKDSVSNQEEIFTL